MKERKVVIQSYKLLKCFELSKLTKLHFSPLSEDEFSQEDR